MAGTHPSLAFICLLTFISFPFIAGFDVDEFCATSVASSSQAPAAGTAFIMKPVVIDAEVSAAVANASASPPTNASTTASPPTHASASGREARVFGFCHPLIAGGYVRCIALPTAELVAKLPKWKVANTEEVLCPDGLFFHTESQVSSKSRQKTQRSEPRKC